MKIEAGKRYVMRNGERTGPMEPHDGPGAGAVYVWSDGLRTWTAKGEFDSITPQLNCEYDLVSEYVEPAASLDSWPPGYSEPDAYDTAVQDALAEVRRAKAAWPGEFNSAHEGFAILNEEFDELRGHVWTNQKRRDLAAMRKEAVQVAAMALRFAAEVCDEMRGRK